jgi:acetyl esterase
MLEAGDAGPPVDFATLAPVDERADSEVRLRALGGATVPVATVENLRAGDQPVRIYRPTGAQHTILFIHGGGWVVGSLDTHDNSCRHLAVQSNCNVVSIGYRKAPEAPFPAAVTDCDRALDWLLGAAGELGLDVSRLVVCGESAGGNLAAILAIHARDRGIALAGQALIYPVIDTRMDTSSYRQFAQGFFLSADAMEWFIRHYAPPEERQHPDIVPLNAQLAGLAPAFIATADHDPLRDEGRAYAAALISAEVETSFIEIEGAVHGIWIMDGITRAGLELIEKTARWIVGRQAD